MGHYIYNTEGIVLSSFPVGESDKLFNIFTKELGLVQAKAQGIRKIESKNRYGLQDFSLSNFSLVRGREIWRITNVSAEKNLFNIFKTNRNKLNSLFNIIIIIQRFVKGEEKNEELFDLLKEFLYFLQKEDLKNVEYRNFELIFYIKILNNLGYFDKKIQKEKFVKFLDRKIERSLLSEMEIISKEAEKEINKSIEETHL